MSRPHGAGVPVGRLSPHVSMGRATIPLLWGAALGGGPAVWSISHRRRYCSRESTIRPPHPCGLSCGASLLGRRPPPGLCIGSPPWLRVTLAMVPDAAWPGSDQRPWGTARWVGWVAPVRRTPGVWFVVTRPSAALGAHVCAVSTAPWRLFTSVPDQRVLVCGVCGHLALVHRCARPAWSCARCAWPLGACSPVCVPGVFRA